MNGKGVAQLLVPLCARINAILRGAGLFDGHTELRPITRGELEEFLCDARKERVNLALRNGYAVDFVTGEP